MWGRLAFFLFAFLIYAQVMVDASERGVVFLGYFWESPPGVDKPGVLNLMFYLRERHIDVSVNVRPLCGFVEEVSGFRAATLGPGAVSVKVSLWAKRFNATCAASVVYRWRYVDRGFSLAGGGEAVEIIQLHIPPLPELYVSASGVAVLGMPSAINVSVSLRGVRGGVLRLVGEGAEVLSPTADMPVGPGAFTFSALVIAESPSPHLSVVFEGVDASGRLLKLSSLIPIQTSPPPVALVMASPARLASTGGFVNITVLLPGAYDGVANIRFVDASANSSVYVAEIRGGRGSASMFVIPTADAVEARVEVHYVVYGVVKTEHHSLRIPVLPSPGAGVARLAVSPSLLVGGVVNDVYISVSAPGRFNASLVIDDAAVDKAMPYLFGGVGNVTVRLGVMPLGRSVTARLEVWGSEWRESYRVVLPVADGGAFVVKPLVNKVPAGSVAHIPVSILYTGLEQVHAVLIFSSPASATAVYELDLSPQRPVVVNYSISIPATQAGAIKVDYEIYYSTYRSVGRSAGSFYISTYQEPRVEVLSVEVSPRRPVAGSPFFVMFTLYNSGFAEAYNINVTLSAPEEVSPVTSMRQIVGRLAPQESAVVSFGLNATAHLASSLTARIEYVDAYGQRYVKTVAVPITSYAQQTHQSRGQGEWAGLVVLVVIAAVLLFIALKGGKRTKPAG
jgi:hypothetical protein